MSDKQLDKLRTIVSSIDECMRKAFDAKKKDDMHNFLAYLSEAQVAKGELEQQVRKMLRV